MAIPELKISSYRLWLDCDWFKVMNGVQRFVEVCKDSSDAPEESSTISKQIGTFGCKHFFGYFIDCFCIVSDDLRE